MTLNYSATERSGRRRDSTCSRHCNTGITHCKPIIVANFSQSWHKWNAARDHCSSLPTPVEIQDYKDCQECHIMSRHSLQKYQVLYSPIGICKLWVNSTGGVHSICDWSLKERCISKLGVTLANASAFNQIFNWRHNSPFWMGRTYD